MRSVGLFAGIGGFEVGLQRAGIATELVCEYWDPAAAVLEKWFDADLVGDIRAIRHIPHVDVVTAGFPCTDLSQVGRTAGINGNESGLVREAFRLIEKTPPRWVVLENVPNMLSLGGGAAMSYIAGWFEERGWNWAYRTVDSQYFGVPQRRRRITLVASRTEDPRTVLFSDDHESTVSRHVRAHGFYWTEGNRGVGWGDDVVPTLKGGSKLGIPSPPAIWRKSASPGHAIVRPRIEVGEQLQGFDAGWTAGTATLGQRWKMVGNAVTVPVAEWVGGRLLTPGEPVEARRPLVVGDRWPAAASTVRGVREQWAVSESPVSVPRTTISALLGRRYDPLSSKATRGFHSRLVNSRLRAGGQPFKEALASHIRAMAVG